MSAALKRLRDPVYNYIRLDEVAEALIDTPEFQRLRHVKQLGTAYLVFPGAHHTRFEHSLGAHHLARLASEQLGLTPDDGRLLEYALLLHDIGHGPFSHVSEELFRDEAGSHVDVGASLIEKGRLGDIIERAGLDKKVVISLMRGKGPRGGLVSGQVDLDRMDYLVRDSHYTGVAIGVDSDRIISKLRLVKDGVCVLEDGLLTAEMLLIARFNMYTSVYFHRTCRIAELMIRRAMGDGLAAGEYTAAELSRMDDIELVSRFRSKSSAGHRMMERLASRTLYKECHAWGTGELPSSLIARLAGEHTARSALETEIETAAKLKAAEVLIDVPALPTQKSGGMDILRDDGTVVPIGRLSKLVSNLEAAEADYWRMRVLAPRGKEEVVARAARGVLENLD
ncbi:MAG: HD domain-containing protein [Euryarchaeota archaeon]|nr:HD domain-containing protein [Euryarchaeota archaeon]